MYISVACSKRHGSMRSTLRQCRMHSTLTRSMHSTLHSRSQAVRIPHSTCVNAHGSHVTCGIASNNTALNMLECVTCCV